MEAGGEPERPLGMAINGGNEPPHRATEQPPGSSLPAPGSAGDERFTHTIPTMGVAAGAGTARRLPALVGNKPRYKSVRDNNRLRPPTRVGTRLCLSQEGQTLARAPSRVPSALGTFCLTGLGKHTNAFVCRSESPAGKL